MRIAIVEDHPAERELIATMCAEYFNGRNVGATAGRNAMQTVCDVFPDAKSFIESWKNSRYDLLLLDCYLSDENLPHATTWHVAFGNPAVTMDRRLIAYALSNAHYVEFTFADGTQTKIRTNFSDVDQRLTVFDNFYRTARGVLVNFDYVSGITNAQFVMKGGKRIPITKTAVTTTCRAYAEYTFTRMRTED